MTSMPKLKLMAIIKSVKVSVTSMPIMASMTTTMMRTKSSMKIENTMINNKIARTRIALLRALSIFWNKI